MLVFFRLYNLFESIDMYILKDCNPIHGDLTVGMMCLCKAHGKYNRAKVVAIEYTPERGMMITVFFVDLGLRSVLHKDDLLDIPEYLVKIKPFQVSNLVLVV